MPEIRAVVFDLYGTLLEVRHPFLRRDVPRLFGVSVRRWLDLIRSDLLTRSFPDLESFGAFLCRELAPDRATDLLEPFLELLGRELNAVRLAPGALPLLTFLRRRGFKVGLLSNLSSAYVAPVARLGLSELADAAVYSCEFGRTKPDPEVYREVCRRLGVAPAATLVVGDSLQNDVLAPIAHGLSAVRVGGAEEDGALPLLSDLGRLALAGSAPLRPLLAPGRRIQLGAGAATVDEVRPLAAGSQGRYNLVWKVTMTVRGNAGAQPRVSHRGVERSAGGAGDGDVFDPTGAESESAVQRAPGTEKTPPAPMDPALQARGGENGGLEVRTYFAKRYLLPESAWVEELAGRVLGIVGLGRCSYHVLPGPEPILLATPAPGSLCERVEDPAVAHELGRHMAFAFVFANADIRPRNVFLSRAGGQPSLTVVDLEHCFLNEAIHPSDLPEPFDPRAIDALGAAHVASLVAKKVLTDRTLRRARSEFFTLAETSSEVVSAFRAGFIEAHFGFNRVADAVLSVIEKRIYQRPYLIVGTRSYRRAMARIDIESIRSRLATPPEPVLAIALTPRR